MAQAVGSGTGVSARQKLRAWALVAAWTAVVFALSQAAFSATSTSRFLGPFLVYVGFSPEQAAAIHLVVRKAAHVVEYALLAFLAARAASLSLRTAAAATAAGLGLVLAVASADEWGQSFDPARTGTPRDVALDMTGAVLGAAAWNLGRRLLR